MYPLFSLPKMRLRSRSMLSVVWRRIRRSFVVYAAHPAGIPRARRAWAMAHDFPMTVTIVRVIRKRASSSRCRSFFFFFKSSHFLFNWKGRVAFVGPLQHGQCTKSIFLKHFSSQKKNWQAFYLSWHRHFFFKKHILLDIVTWERALVMCEHSHPFFFFKKKNSF